MKRIAAINDISGFGKCSLTAAIPIISALGVQVCPLPTAVLSNQTCFESFYIKDLTDSMEEIAEKWDELGFKFDGIYSGFLSNERQTDFVMRLTDMYRDAVYILDPVMGDEGKPYKNFTDGLLKNMLNLTEKADVITPNITELCMLTGNSMKTDIISISKMAKSLMRGRLKTVVVTGIREYDNIQNIVFKSDSYKIFNSKKIGDGFSGTGDIMSSIIAGFAVKGLDIYRAVDIASKFISHCISETMKHDFNPQHGIDFENMLGELIKIDG
ncbi:MAG: pyridoxamine kinase [Clostridia bacterium]|jgi:pyridoxine kinase|nr:pyridoxamine kinase [Clostridia bacterium]MCI2014869.1 pyridoxamine kinase [Clostridia bacterium]